MFIAVLFTIARTWKQFKCPSMDTEVATHIHNEYQSSIKKKQANRNNEEILPFATTWRDFKGIMLNEITQTEKDKYCMISFIYEI